MKKITLYSKNVHGELRIFAPKSEASAEEFIAALFAQDDECPLDIEAHSGLVDDVPVWYVLIEETFRTGVIFSAAAEALRNRPDMQEQRISERFTTFRPRKKR